MTKLIIITRGEVLYTKYFTISKVIMTKLIRLIQGEVLALLKIDFTTK